MQINIDPDQTPFYGVWNGPTLFANVPFYGALDVSGLKFGVSTWQKKVIQYLNVYSFSTFTNEM